MRPRGWWTYKALSHGIMCEVFTMTPCHSRRDCRWDENIWKKEVLRRAGGDAKTAESSAQATAIIVADRLPRGFTSIRDRRYMLRPEAIGSIFAMYRITELLQVAWDMLTAVNSTTSPELASSAVGDVTVTAGERRRSLLMGETLKYFTSSSVTRGGRVDGFVFSTEAHPFRRMAE